MKNTRELAETVYAALHIDRLRPEMPRPTRDDAIDAIEGCLNKHNGAWRRTAPSGDRSRLLWQLVKFHRGNGSLWGYPWFADEDMRAKMDTLALVMLRGESRAAEAWRKALS